MAVINLSFVGAANANPASPPVGFTYKGATQGIIAGQEWGNDGSANTVWQCDAITSNIFSAEIFIATINPNGRGISITNSSGNGFMFLVRNTDVRIFALTAYVLSGSVLATYTATIAANATITIDVTQSTGTYVVKYNGTTLNTFINTTYTSGLYAGLLARGGFIRSFALTYTPLFSLTNTTIPLVPNTNSNWTCTGFTNGAAVLSFNGITIPVTIASGSFSATIPMISDEFAWPKLPATAITFTLTQSASVAIEYNNISLPTGFNQLLNYSGVAANFSNINTTNNAYLGYWFNSKGIPLTTSDSAIFPNVDNYKIYENSGVGVDINIVPLPRTDTIYIYRGATGKYVEYQVTLTTTVTPPTGGGGTPLPFKLTIRIGFGFGF